HARNSHRMQPRPKARGVHGRVASTGARARKEEAMKSAALKYGALLLTICAATPSLHAVEVTDADRTYGNFMRDAATVGDGKIRLELRGMTMENENEPRITLAGVPVDDFEQVRNICKNHTDRGCDDPKNDFELDKVQGGTIDLLGSYGLGKNG